MFKLLRKITMWYFRKIERTDQELVKNSNLALRAMLNTIADDPAVPSLYRNNIKDYLYRTRKELLRISDVSKDS